MLVGSLLSGSTETYSTSGFARSVVLQEINDELWLHFALIAVVVLPALFIAVKDGLLTQT